jgi:CHAD domain-containing protein
MRLSRIPNQISFTRPEPEDPPMPYSIQPSDEDVESALRRIAREEAEGALAAIRAEVDLGPRVHEMRKAVKKLRGLLRLVRPVFPEAGAENAVLRDAGRGLSGLRDAAVQLATLEDLSEGMDAARRADLLAPFQEAAPHHDARAGSEMLPPFADAMASLRDRSEGWTLRRDGWDALEPGLKATWEAARKAMKQARRHPEPEHLHEWRKRAKDHWYQARLLHPIWPAMMKPHVEAADELGEVLGDINDLAVLRERLDLAPLAAALRSEARDLASLRHAELMARAIPLGRRLFAGPAVSLAARWGAWWTLREAP